MKAGAKVFLDRIEGDLAVFVLDKHVFELPKSVLPEGTKEGAWFTLGLEPDPQKVEDVGQEIAKLMKELSADD